MLAPREHFHPTRGLIMQLENWSKKFKDEKLKIYCCCSKKVHKWFTPEGAPNFLSLESIYKRKMMKEIQELPQRINNCYYLLLCFVQLAGRPNMRSMNYTLRSYCRMNNGTTRRLCFCLIYFFTLFPDDGKTSSFGWVSVNYYRDVSNWIWL